MGKIKEISRGKVCRKRNPVVYIICEGAETEVRYFKRFRTRGCHIDIIPIPSQYRAADRLVQKARATMGISPYYPDEGDVIWCVFDRDENSDEVLQRAWQTALRKGYQIAYSNPSFELWYLLHFADRQTEVSDSHALIRMLRQPGRLEQYKKNQDVYDQLEPLQKKAAQRARQRIRSLEEKHVQLISRNSNPVTTVVYLTEFLNARR